MSSSSSSSSLPRISRSLIVGGSEVPLLPATAEEQDSPFAAYANEEAYLWPTYASAFAWSGIGSIGWGCGGALIHDDIIVTGAHCQWVYHVGGLGVWIGAKNSSDSNINASNFYAVSKVVLHPNYTDQKEVYNDIMLVKINGTTVNNNQAVVYDYNKDPKVPAQNGDNVRVVGFGKTTEGGNISETLRQVDVQYVDSTTCPSTWSQYDSHLHLCAGTNEGGKDSCDSDSGSPLFLVPPSPEDEEEEDGRRRRPIVVGLVGDGIGCGRAGIPALYTRVSTYADWMHETICEISSHPPRTCSSNNNNHNIISNGGSVGMGTTATAEAWSGWNSASDGTESSSVEQQHVVPILSGSSSKQPLGALLAALLAVMAVIKLSIYVHKRWNSHRRRQGYQTVESNDNHEKTDCSTSRIVSLSDKYPRMVPV